MIEFRHCAKHKILDATTSYNKHQTAETITMSPKKRQAEDNPSHNPKKNKKRKANAPDHDTLDTELGLNTLFTKMDNQLLADHLAQKLSRFGSDLSAVEISDLTVSGKAEIPSTVPTNHASQRHSRHDFMAGSEDIGKVSRLSRERL